MRVEKHGEGECYASFFFTDHTRGKGNYVMENLNGQKLSKNLNKI